MRGTDLTGFPFEVVSKLPAAETDSFTDGDPPADKAFYRAEEVTP